jgi:hypothetical protein
MKSTMRFIKSALEYRPVDDISIVPIGLRGIYALYKSGGRSYDVVYVGMSGKNQKGRIKSRLNQHKKSSSKDWTHFSYYEVWDNVSEQEILEIEGLFRQLYRFDSRANRHNIQQTHKPLRQVRRQTEAVLGVNRMSKKGLGL